MTLSIVCWPKRSGLFTILISIIFLCGLRFGHAQTAEIKPIYFNVESGRPVTNPGGLHVSITAINDAVIDDRIKFSATINVINTGSKAVIIYHWDFYAICPENVHGQPYQDDSYVPLVTPYIENSLILQPGQKKAFSSASTDYFWCLPKNRESMKKSAVFFKAILVCATYDDDPLDPAILELLKEMADKLATSDEDGANEIEKQILEVTGHAYPDKIQEIKDLITQKRKSIKALQKFAAPPQTKAKKGETFDGDFGKWLFVQSDKGVQVRYALVKTEGDVGFYKVQFKLAFDDGIFCHHADCLGYLLAFGYPDLKGEKYIYSHMIFYNSFKETYTLPELMPVKLSFPDGSKRFLKKDRGFVYTTKNSSTEIPTDFTYSCVDNVLNGSKRNRCSGGSAYRDLFKEEQATILK